MARETGTHALTLVTAISTSAIAMTPDTPKHTVHTFKGISCDLFEVATTHSHHIMPHPLFGSTHETFRLSPRNPRSNIRSSNLRL